VIARSAVPDSQNILTLIQSNLFKRSNFQVISQFIQVKDISKVNDNPNARDKISNYLRQINAVEDIDIIIALGMASNGFKHIINR
jgi:hypothetical protein